MLVLDLSEEHGARLVLEVDDAGVVRRTALSSGTADLGPSGQSIVEIMTVGTGSGVAGRLDSTVVGSRLRYRSHCQDDTPVGPRLSLTLVDGITHLAAEVSVTLVLGSGTFRSSVTVINQSGQPVQLLAVSSLAIGSALWSPDETLVHRADSDWLAENRWSSGTMYQRGEPRLVGPVHEAIAPRGALSVASRGSWSTGEHLPMGALENRDGTTLLWQVEHNGAWQWQVVETIEGLSVIVTGPTDREANAAVALRPGGSFRAVDASFTIADGGFQGALAGMNRYRRATRRPSPNGARLPVIYNDYMNTLAGDPSTEKLLPLVRAVGRTGAEYFCIDAGWYADEPGWWETVGAWSPSTTRFPNGIQEVISAIRSAGMIPGLWLEPEVVGVRSPIAESLPIEAFLSRGGERLVLEGRYHLDFRHAAVVERMDGIVDGLVSDFGIGFFKFDYNVNAVPGTDVDATSPGEGLLLVGRAFLAWIERLLDRHPGLVVEACASGAMRSDWATMSRFALLSTSDQQDGLTTVPIAASAASVVPPEQAAVWCYPQPGMTGAEWSIALAGGMLARPYMSGFYDRMTADELERVTEFIAAYRAIRDEIADGEPFWPLGLPGWDDDWIAYGLRCRTGRVLVTVWRRGGPYARMAIPIDFQAQGPPTAVLPRAAGTWTATDGGLEVGLAVGCAVTLSLDVSAA